MSGRPEEFEKSLPESGDAGQLEAAPKKELGEVTKRLLQIEKILTGEVAGLRYETKMLPSGGIEITPLRPVDPTDPETKYVRFKTPEEIREYLKPNLWSRLQTAIGQLQSIDLSDPAAFERARAEFAEFAKPNLEKKPSLWDRVKGVGRRLNNVWSWGMAQVQTLLPAQSPEALQAEEEITETTAEAQVQVAEEVHAAEVKTTERESETYNELIELFATEDMRVRYLRVTQDLEAHFSGGLTYLGNDAKAPKQPLLPVLRHLLDARLQDANLLRPDLESLRYDHESLIQVLEENIEERGQRIDRYIELMNIVIDDNVTIGDREQYERDRDHLKELADEIERTEEQTQLLKQQLADIDRYRSRLEAEEAELDRIRAQGAA